MLSLLLKHNVDLPITDEIWRRRSYLGDDTQKAIKALLLQHLREDTVRAKAAVEVNSFCSLNRLFADGLLRRPNELASLKRNYFIQLKRSAHLCSSLF